MKAHALVALGVLAVCSGCAASPAPLTPTSVLPLRSVRLYETGVGYFERSGTLPTDEHAGLPVPAGHLDDALKTLVVLSAGGKTHATGVEFGSSMSHGMARALAGLRQEGDSPVTYEDLLESLQGSVVLVRVRGRADAADEAERESHAVTGRLVNVNVVADAASKDDAGKKPASRLELTLLTDRGEVVHVAGGSVESVRPTDPDQASRLDAALESLLSHGGQSRHALRLLGDAGAPITLGYVAETPVWRTTYRLVLPKEGAPKLQAWALLHNDTDEDWKDVKVELVNGRPDSFLFPLAAPRYARRELVTPENDLSTVPQLMGRTADTLWGDHVDESYGAAGMGLSGTGEGGGGSGRGIGLGSIGTIGHGAGVGAGETTSSLLGVGDLASVSKATGVEAGALFVYGMPGTLELRAHASALVPFLSDAIEAEPIAWVDELRTDRARSAVRFVNSTSQTLPAGTIAFFSDGGFAGESGLDRLKPRERRFLTYGLDLDVEATSHGANVVENVQRVTFRGSQLREHFLRTTDVEWSIENRSGQARAVYLALSRDRNATVAGGDGADYDTESGKPLVVFKVPSKQTVTRKVTSVEGLSRATAFDALSSARLAELGKTPGLDAHDKALVVEASQRDKELEDTRGQLGEAREEMSRLEKDLARLRDDAKAIGDRGALAQPLVTRIVAAEDKVGVVRARVDALEKEEKKRSDAVRDVLSRLSSG